MTKNICNICLEDTKTLYVTPCRHSFCKECILPWLENHNDTCPICRKTVGKSCEAQYHKKEKAASQDV